MLGKTPQKTELIAEIFDENIHLGALPYYTEAMDKALKQNYVMVSVSLSLKAAVSNNSDLFGRLQSVA